MLRQGTPFRRVTSVFAAVLMMLVMALSCVPSSACAPSSDFAQNCSLYFLISDNSPNSFDGQPAAVRRVGVDSVFAALGQKARIRICSSSSCSQFIACCCEHEKSFCDGFSISDEPVRHDLSSGITIKTKHKLE